jgi:hypothetical protein
MDTVRSIDSARPITWLWGVSKCATILQAALAVEAGTFFDWDSSWVEAFDNVFSDLISQTMAPHVTRRHSTDVSGTYVELVEFSPTEKLGWLFRQNQDIPRIWMTTDDRERTRDRIRSVLWKKFEGNSIHMTNSRSGPDDTGRFIGDGQMILKFNIDSMESALPSPTADRMTSYFQKFLDSEINRSVLFYGPPGTGKTTLVRMLVRKLGLKSLRLSADELSTLDTNTICEAIRIFKPNCIIIDDLDRAGMTDSSMLELFEFFKRSVKFVFSTANKTDSMDPSLLRPGRFDELIPITKLDDRVILDMLGPEFEKDFELVKDWPIAYINEYKIRCQFSAKEDAKKFVKELQKRVQKLQTYYEEDDEETEEST